MRFKIGNRVQEKYYPNETGTITKINENPEKKIIIYRVRMRSGSIQMTTGESFVQFKRKEGNIHI